jgi:hypothetical protein
MVSEPALGAFTGGLVGAAVGGVVGGTAFCSYPAAFTSTLVGLIFSGFTGYNWAYLLTFQYLFFCYLHFIIHDYLRKYIHAPIIKLALTALQWNFDIEKAWNQINGRKLIMYLLYLYLYLYGR